MKCPNCGTEIDADSRFCTNCGASIIGAAQSAPASDPEAGTGGAPFSSQPAPSASRDQLNATAEKGKQVAAGYWGFLVRTLKHPIQASYEETSKIYGYISIGLASFFLALGFALMMHNVVSAVTGFYSSDVPAPSMVGPFFGIFFSLAILFLLVAVITYAVVHLAYKAATPFHVFISQYAGQATLGVFASALFFLFELVKLNNFLTAILLVLGIGLFYQPFASIIFTYKNNGTFDRLYTYLITTVVVGIAQSIFISVVALSLLSQIVSELQGLFGSNPFGGY
ncbi:zinc-ribbon domain-containing protein [Sporolactobacillus shoreae]|uniref:Zinc-ribbon domain-containing protein n=1 Tax=Sporolactobacillus shoreae TaxID=1465501 RepID=A0A4Z0GS29_9BACL|nr:zinc ribbon domain-containing protein [Sporolactobacillus shoreae]TGA99737.1 zinc-ribbon domain-containing protein [Sporolactobacillus shoreae]